MTGTRGSSLPDSGLSTDGRRAARAEEGLTARILVLSVVVTIVCGIWVRQAEIVVISTQISESVPAIPALGALMLVLALNALLRAFRPRLSLSRVEVLTLYTFVGIAISMAGVGVIRYWLASITYPFYFARPENELATLQRWIPTWMVPHDRAVIEGLYVGSGVVPWKVWLVPLLAWSGFFTALWTAMLCVLVLVRKRWVHDERLSFPVVELGLKMTDRAPGHGQRPFFLNPVMWIGFAVSFLFNLINILHALNPSMPGLAWYGSVGPSSASLPWSSVFPVSVVFVPLLIGFGFLVSTEICFSIWFFFLLYKLEALLIASFGYASAEVPYVQEQSIGCYLLLGMWSLWAVRGTVKRAWAQLLGRARSSPDDGGPFALRWALLGLVVSSTAVLLFCVKGGMAWWVAVAYMTIVGLVAVVCARIRAEVGIPLVWAFPFWMQKKILLYTLGTAVFMQQGTPATLTLLALLAFLSRGYFPALIGYQADGIRTAERAHMKPHHMAWVIMLALIVGLGIAYYFHLVPYYCYGATHLRGDIWGSGLARSDFGEVMTATLAPIPASPARITATAWGVVVTGALIWARQRLAWAPLHPLGFAITTAYGDLVWFPFLLVWLCKVPILRYGGIKLYRAAVPGFLGFALGHAFTAGLVWGLIGAAVPHLVSGYQVWFG